MSQDDVAQRIIDAGEAGLWQQMEPLLTARTKAEPADTLALQRLATMYRQQGDLQKAAKAYAELANRNPDDVSSQVLAAVCDGRRPPVSVAENQTCAAPFVSVPGFLTADDRQRLLHLLEKNESKLEELEVSYVHAGEEQHANRDRSMRYQYGIYCEAELQEIFVDRIEQRLPEWLNILQVDAFAPGRHTLRLDTTPVDGFGRMHQDVGFGAKLIYLYYFHTHPRRFTGGDLLVHDQNVADNAPAHDQFTTLKHVDNTLVMFEPHYFHEVTRVKSTHGELSPLDARLSVCGFLHPG